MLNDLTSGHLEIADMGIQIFQGRFEKRDIFLAQEWRNEKWQGRKGSGFAKLTLMKFFK